MESPPTLPQTPAVREYTSAVQQWTDLLLDPNQPVEFEQGLQDLNDNIQAVLDLDPAWILSGNCRMVGRFPFSAHHFHLSE